jgi:predicted DNA-binding transcriptional regulator AlpA
MIERDQTMTIDELAEFLHTKVGTIYYWRSTADDDENRLPKARKVGRRLVWLRSEVEQWLAERPASSSAPKAS